ncbi:28S ribosomal protein S9, mitochondrial [Microplitis demolitor]|uniref:28S ribosomal protein S9, mitochondrial n=1 Tax=Microplitis demolitor TaxID=69319 RepID=UPI0004CCB50B|nr:28S ribosomal protein S9, mitochondrial [Microplitis demolitor]
MLMNVNTMLRQCNVSINSREITYAQVLLKSYFSTHVENTGDDRFKYTKKMNNAMKAYLQRAEEYDKYIKKETREYQIGKRHLANMMGENPDTFNQDSINKSIEYLFPSGLYEPKARPIMEEAQKIFPPKRAAQFNEEGRPFQPMFYTTRPNYYSVLYDIVEQIEILNKFEDSEMKKGILPNETNKANLLGSDWMTKTEIEKVFLEPIHDNDYEALLAALQRLALHPYSASALNFIMKFRTLKKVQTEALIIPPLEYDDQGRPFITVTGCWRNTSTGVVKILGNGSGKITINGQDITYFHHIQYREQVIFPLIFTGMEKSVDIEATVENGGPTGQSGAIRWGIAWGLRSFVDKKMIEKMRIAGLLTRDWRTKERKKPGQEGARRKFTWKKR